jgi:hypothetical protein
VLRVVGNHVGPVLRTGPPVDRVAAQMQWYESMDELATRKRPTGRFVREPSGAESASQDLLNR